MKFQINKTKLPNFYNHNSPVLKTAKFDQVIGYGHNSPSNRDNTITAADAHQKNNTTTAKFSSTKENAGLVYNAPDIRDKNANNFQPYACNSYEAEGDITSPASPDKFGHF